MDWSVTRAAGDEDFVTAVFAELDPGGWLQLVTCGHPPPLRLAADGGLRALTPRAFATPLGLHPDIQLSTFSVSAGDRLLFYTDGLLEARDRRAGTSGWKTALTRCGTRTCRQPWTGCSTGSWRTQPSGKSGPAGSPDEFAQRVTAQDRQTAVGAPGHRQQVTRERAAPGNTRDQRPARPAQPRPGNGR